MFDNTCFDNINWFLLIWQNDILCLVIIAEPQIRAGIEANSKIIFLISQQKHVVTIH